jgi:hypothetical protein
MSIGDFLGHSFCKVRELRSEQEYGNMKMEPKFIRDRGEATGDVQVQLVLKWEWDEKEAGQWALDVAAVDAQDVIVGEKLVGVLAARGDLDLHLGLLHEKTSQMLGMSLIKYRHQSNKLVLLENLHADGDSRKAILSEALELIPVWEKIDPSYAPIATNTLTLFKEAHAQGVLLMAALKKADVYYKEENEILDGMIEKMNDDCVAWYAEAGKVFKLGTPEGDLIRGEVPTTYDQLPAPKQPIISDQDSPAPGKIEFKMTARYANVFDVYLQSPTEDAPVKVAEDVPGPAFEKSGLSAGQYSVSVVGKNSKGNGPMSEAVGIPVG